MDYKQELANRIKEAKDSSLEDSLFAEKYERSEYFRIEPVRAQLPTLELRLANGDSEGIPYLLIQRWKYQRSEGILLQTAAEKIIISGRNLKVLFNFLLIHRVKYIQCNIGNDMEEDESKLFVKSIIIEEV